MRKFLTVINILLSVVIICLYPTVISATEYRIEQEEVKGPDKPADNNAYIIFSDTPQMENMSFVDGLKEDRYSVTYSEKAEFAGVQGRQVFAENYLYVKLDKSFAKKEDSVFCISIDYWDYSGAGVFYIDYTNNKDGEENYQRITVPKLGVEGTDNPKWWRIKVYIDDACFDGKMDYDSDFRIVSRAYNTFSKIEVRNLSRDAMTSTEDFGVFNTKKAQSLNYLQMYDGVEGQETFNPGLERVLTRGQAIKELIISYAYKQDAIENKYPVSYTDVPEDLKPYVGIAEKLGIIDKANLQLFPEEKITQAELVEYYLRLLGIKYNNDTLFETARENFLILPGNMIFQPIKTANYDNFVALAMNCFALENANDGQSAFGRLFKEGFYSEQNIVGAQDETLSNWLLSNSFKIKPKYHKDETTGRVWYSIDFLGSNARKQYYTAQCWSTDNERFYFMDNSYRMWEYNIRTHMAKFIDYLAYGVEYNIVVSPKNNLFYQNNNREFVKMNLDDYTRQVVAKLPDWQLSKSQYIQVNNAETRMSVEWRDTSGEFDPTKCGRLAVCDLTTGEWDLRWKYGFDTEWYYPDHICINPVYDNYLFFAHEGTYQKDRVWVLNMETASYYNVIKQKPYTADRIGEDLVHEWWSYDGEWIMAVKGVGMRDGLKRGLGEQGVVMSRPDGTDKRYVVTDESLGHACSSTVTNRWIVSDTTYGKSAYSNLYLIDSFTGENIFLTAARQKNANPGHQHPQFSPDGNMIIFGLWSDDDTTVEIGWMDVSDIVNKPIVGGNYDVSETCSTFGYEGFDHFIVKQQDKDGQEYFLIPAGNSMNVNVKSSIIESDKTNAEITIEYLDNSTLPLKIDYVVYFESMGGVGKLIDKKVYIDRKNTGKWKEETISIRDINLGNMLPLGTDFKVSGVSVPAYIKTIDVKVK